MEDSLTSRDHEVPDQNTEITGEHDGEDSPKPVGSSHSDVLGDIVGDRVLLECVVAHVELL